MDGFNSGPVGGDFYYPTLSQKQNLHHAAFYQLRYNDGVSTVMASVFSFRWSAF